METLGDLWFIVLGTLITWLHVKPMLGHWWALRRANKRAVSNS